MILFLCGLFVDFGITLPFSDPNMNELVGEIKPTRAGPALSGTGL